MNAIAAETHQPRGNALFARVACGVDDSDAGTAAAVAAGRLTPPDGDLILVHVADGAAEPLSPWPADATARAATPSAAHAMTRAQAQSAPFHATTAEVLYGSAPPRLPSELEARRATVAVVGTHRSSRALGVVLGSVATRIVHRAPCSVLVVRNVPDPIRFPRRIVVGDDGSREAAAAVAEADALAARFGARLRTLVATGGPPLDIERLRGREALEWDDRDPAEALVAASRDADLVVVGSRRLHGAQAIGSVSERVAHGAACSVLIVRAPPSP